MSHMSQRPHEHIEEVILHSPRVLRMNAVVMGIVLGVLAGAVLFMMTVVLLIKGGEDVGAHLKLIGQFFPGYKVTFIGAVIGFVYAFVCAFVIGWVGCKLYNAVADMRERSANAKRASARSSSGGSAGGAAS